MASECLLLYEAMFPRYLLLQMHVNRDVSPSIYFSDCHGPAVTSSSRHACSFHLPTARD